jgi:DNA helicase-2/ATP-dependent DNA helicase PcrA
MIYEDVVDEFNEFKTKYGYANFDDLLTIMLETLKEKDLI